MTRQKSKPVVMSQKEGFGVKASHTDPFGEENIKKKVPMNPKLKRFMVGFVCAILVLYVVIVVLMGLGAWMFNYDVYKLVSVAAFVGVVPLSFIVAGVVLYRRDSRAMRYVLLEQQDAGMEAKTEKLLGL